MTLLQNLSDKAIAAGFLLAAATLAPAAAQALTVGDIGNVGNSFPFGRYASFQNDYQIVYNSSNFSGPTRISGISFLRSTNEGTNLTDTVYGISFHYLNGAYGESSGNFDDNLGAEIADWRAIAVGGPAQETLRFTGPGFTYDPGIAPLILHIRVLSGFDGVASAAAHFATSGTDRLYRNFQSVGAPLANAGSALTTVFDTSPAGAAVPLPAAAPLLAFGLAGIGLVARRRHD